MTTSNPSQESTLSLYNAFVIRLRRHVTRNSLYGGGCRKAGFGSTYVSHVGQNQPESHHFWLARLCNISFTHVIITQWPREHSWKSGILERTNWHGESPFWSKGGVMIFKVLAQNIIPDMQKDNFVIIHPSSPISPTFLMIFTSISCYFYDTPTQKKTPT